MSLQGRKRGTKDILYGAACIAIIAISIAGYAFIDNRTNTQEYEQLVLRARSLAALIDPSQISQLTLTESDLSNPVYIDLKNKLTAVREQDSAARFVYLMGKRDDHVYFMADSEDPNSPDYSPPGQEYTEASDALMSGWSPEIPYVLEIDEDRWGEWISALAPIRDANGRTIALIGIDQSAAAHRVAFMTAVALLVLATFALLLLVGVLYILSKKEEETINMKTDFVAIASHELRTPLGAVRWKLSVLKADTTLPDTVRSALESLYAHVCALIDLTSTFLQTTSVAYDLMNKKDLQPMDIAEIVRGAVERARTVADTKQITISADSAFERPISVKGDRERLRLVFDNLLSNAIKYSPEGAKISVLYAENPKTKTVSVCDGGIGIPEDEVKKIFDGFYRASNAKRHGTTGSGFGLFIVKKIVEFHGGEIRCESTRGKGTTFHVVLPARV